MKKEQIRVFIADDHELIRQGLKRIIRFEENMCIVGEVDNGEDVMKMVEKTNTDILLLDMNMPGIDGLTVLKNLKGRNKDIKIIILTVEKNHGIIREAIQIGVDGYILKESAGEQVVKAITDVYKGNKYIDSSLVSFLFSNFQEEEQASRVLDQLTKRELEVLHYISKGCSNKEIGENLFLSEKTVKNYATNLFRKLEITDRVHAAIFALEEDVEEYYQKKFGVFKIKE